MKKNGITKTAGRTLHKLGFLLRKKSPEILLATGIAGVIVSAVMACKATTKAGEIADETANTLNEIHEAKTTGVTKADSEHAEKDIQNDLVIAYVHAGVKYAQLYAPSVAVGATSIACILASHGILKKRNLALAAALTSVSDRFKEYRGRVVERFGENIDRELRYNIKTKEIEETVTDEEGHEKKVKKTVEIAGPLGRSDYARFFDSDSRLWEKDGSYNLMFLRAQQCQANDKLHSQGYLFLNDVYRMLGLRESVAGQSVGWVYDRSASAVGDNYVDFGITELYQDAQDHPEEEPERTILLDFNVDGDIMSIFPKFDRTH